MILASPSENHSGNLAAGPHEHPDAGTDGAVRLQDIEFGVDEHHVATITLNRPDALNAISGRMAGELAWAWQTVRDTDEIHAVVLRAAGDRAFCTGVDVKGDGSWFFRSNVWNTFDPGTVISPKLHHRCWKPVITAVHGFAAGGAQYLLNESDIIICSDDAAFFDPHANASIVSALEPMGMLHRGVPLGEVLRWALMGTEERISAATALRIGLVSEVVERAALWDRAQAIAESIAARNTVAIQGTIRAIWESLDMTRSTALQNGMAYTHIGNPPLTERRAAPRRNGPPVYR
ncbi:enoyl-CoA hydratase/isomerase family protein [Mycobacterium sp. SMC-4]|uniref:enoyl-CoA hydratase/isomerase family protein n=1 Tax=Mycobacterium sp. SMC-4 TaxID=2857059 RepID=UPI003D02F6F4